MRRASAQRALMRPPAARASCSQQAARVAPASQQVGPLDAAAVEGARAARVEGAAGRDRVQARHRAVDLQQPLAVLVHRRDRAHQARRCRDARAVDHLVHRADLGDAAGVHHGDAVAGLGDHAHVVRDQHHRGAVLLAQALEQRNDLRLDRHVERRGRLVGDDQLRLGRPAPARSPRAGACRRRTGAGTGRCAAAAAGMPVSCSSAIGAPARLGRVDRQVRLDRLDQLPADRVERVQRGQRVLEDGADLAAADRAASPRTAGCRCAGRRAGSRRRRCAPAARAGR